MERIKTPTWLVFIAGLTMAVFVFIPREPFVSIWRFWLPKWSIIIGSFALLLGVDSLVMHNIRRVMRRQDTLYAATILVGFVITLVWGFWAWWRYGSPFTLESTYVWLFRYVFVPLDATMFALLAFFIASAAYRAFRAREFSGTLLLASATIVMLGRVPYGDIAAVWVYVAFAILLAYYFFKNYPKYEGLARGIRLLAGLFFGITGLGLLVSFAGYLLGSEGLSGFYTWTRDLVAPLAGWIMNVPQMAARRGIDLGLSLGSLVFSIRVLLGMERGYMR